MKLFHFDIETTGLLYWRHGIHQIAGIIEIDGVEQDRFNFYIKPNPACIIEQSALDVCGVTKEQIEGYEPMLQTYGRLISILGKYVDKYKKEDKFFIVGYNCQAFDIPFLRAWFKQNNDEYFGSWFWSVSLDVMVLAQFALMQDRAGMKSFQLSDVAEKCDIEIDSAKTHNAIYDVEVTKKVYEFICLNK